MFHDIIPDIVKWLPPKLGGVKVSASVPSTMPDSLVTLLRIGTWTYGTSTHTNVDRPVIRFTCWGKTRAKAMRLGSQVRNAIADIETDVFHVTHYEFSSIHESVGAGGEFQCVIDCVLVVR